FSPEQMLECPGQFVEARRPILQGASEFLASLKSSDQLVQGGRVGGDFCRGFVQKPAWAPAGSFFLPARSGRASWPHPFCVGIRLGQEIQYAAWHLNLVIFLARWADGLEDVRTAESQCDRFLFGASGIDEPA